MAFTFAILFEGVLDGDGFIHEELSIHRFDCCIRRFEVGIGDKAVAF
jgi:hypothetical protein